METETIRNDIQTVGKEVEQKGEITGRVALKLAQRLLNLLRKIFKSIASAVYRNRIAGLKRVKADGKTKELTNIKNLSYDEMQEIAVKAREEEIPFVIKEQNDNSISKKNTLRQINKFTKTKYNLEKAKKKLDDEPQNAKYLKKVEKWQKLYDSELAKKEGKTYAITMNKSRQGFLDEINILLINKRTDFAQSEFKKDILEKSKNVVYDEAKFQAFLDYCKNEGKLTELNQDQLKAEWLKHNGAGTVDVSKFEKNYNVHTVDSKSAGQITIDLDNEGIEYAVEKENIDGGEIIKLYINDEDMAMYNSKGYSKSGMMEHYGSKSKDIDKSSKPISFDVSLSKVQEMQRIMKDEKYSMYYRENNYGEPVVTFTAADAAFTRAGMKEKNANAVQESYEKALEKEKSRTREAYRDRSKAKEIDDIWHTNPIINEMDKCGRPLSDKEFNEFYEVYHNGTQEQLDTLISNIKNENSVDIVEKVSQKETNKETEMASDVKSNKDIDIDLPDADIDKE